MRTTAAGIDDIQLEEDREKSKVQCHIRRLCQQVPCDRDSHIPPPPHICLGNETVGRGQRLKWVRPTQMEGKTPTGSVSDDSHP